jgi:hypothetical protein
LGRLFIQAPSADQLSAFVPIISKKRHFIRRDSDFADRKVGSVARFGHLARSNQGDSRNLRRTDTPMLVALADVTGEDWPH